MCRGIAGLKQVYCSLFRVCRKYICACSRLLAAVRQLIKGRSLGYVRHSKSTRSRKDNQVLMSVDELHVKAAVIDCRGVIEDHRDGLCRVRMIRQERFF